MANNKKGIKAGQAYVQAFWDDSAVVRGLKAMRAKFASAGAGLMTIGGGLLGAGAGLGALFAKPIADAGKMQAAFASFDTIFKSSAKEMGTWGDDLAKTLGRSKTQVREFMTMTQGRLLAAGMDEGSANALNKQLTTRAFDLAQFWDTDDETAVQAMQNALTGEMEMLKQFGIVISQADVDGRLKAMGLDPRTASQAEKVQARFDLMMTRSKEVQGTAARESGEFSSLTKRASAVVQELSESVGAALLPAILPLLSAFSSWVGRAGEFIKSNAWLVQAVAAGAVAIATLGGAFLAAGAIFSTVAPLIGGIVTAVGFLISPFGIVVGLVTAAGAGLAYAGYQSGVFGQVVDWLQAKFGPLATAFADAFGVIRDALSAGEFAAAANVLWAALKLAFAQGIAWLQSAWIDFRSFMATVFINLASQVESIWNGMTSAMVSAITGAVSQSLGLLASLADKLGLTTQAMQLRMLGTGFGAGAIAEGAAGRSRAGEIEQARLDAENAIAEEAARQQAELAAGPAEAADELRAAMTAASLATWEADKEAAEPPPTPEETTPDETTTAAKTASQSAKTASNQAAIVNSTEAADALYRALSGTSDRENVTAAVEKQTQVMERQHREQKSWGRVVLGKAKT